ncbi:MAG: family 16 glycosylhydrolase [Gammaproteobacteria bacterium]|nr:family 16 glycosylhydrolase [Gammaproteobacteria bacterium]
MVNGENVFITSQMIIKIKEPIGEIIMTSSNTAADLLETIAALKAKQVAGTITAAELELLNELEAQLAEETEQEESKGKEGVKEDASIEAGATEANLPETLEPEGEADALSGVGYSLPLAGLGLLGLSAGGSSGGSVVASTASASFSGSVINGYVQGAKVFQDTNNNGVFDAGEPNDLTDANGSYTLQGYVPKGGSIIAAPTANTIDKTSGVAVTTVFSGGSETQVISPFSTLIETTNLTEAQVKTAFGLDNNINISTFDPIAAALDSNASSQNVEAALKYKAVSTSVSNLLDLGSETLATGSTTAELGAKAVAQAIEGAIQNANGSQVDLGNATTIETIVIDAEQKVPLSDASLDFNTLASSVSTKLAAVNQTMITSASGGVSNASATLTSMYKAAKFAQTELSSTMADVIKADTSDRLTKLQEIDSLNVATEINNTVVDNSNLIANSTFETSEGWSGNAANVRENEGFNYANVGAAGNAWDVNLSYVLSLVENSSYQLSFKAKGTSGRALKAGLGLNVAPYSSSTEDLTLTEEWQTYTIQINEINFGGDDSRVIFDMGHDVGEVLIDDVELISSASTASTATPATAPTAAATAPTVTDADAIALYSDALTSDNVVTNFNPGWGQSGSLGAATDVDSAVGNVLKFSNLNYQGIDLNSTDVSAKESLHLDLWSETAGKVKLFLVSTDGSNNSEAGIVLEVTAGQWNSFDVDLDAFPGVDLASVFQMKFDSQSSIIGSDDGLSNFYMDNLYFSDTTATVGTPATATVPEGFALAFTDTFDNVGSQPDTTNWTFDLGNDGWGNNEVQDYQSDANDAVIVDVDPTEGVNGALRITAQNSSGTITSARVKSQIDDLAPYGYYEIRARLPSEQGAWPAIWLLGQNGRAAWPAEGEIDIVEWSSAYADEAAGNEIISALHFTDHHAGSGISTTETISSAVDEWHTYQLWWTPDSIRVGIDGDSHLVYEKPANATDDSWPFDDSMDLIMNIAIGGTLGGSVPSEDFVYAMDIDYVKVYRPEGMTVTFETSDSSGYSLVDFGGVASEVVTANQSTGSDGGIVKLTKASGAETWSGTTFMQLDAGDLLGDNSTIVSMDVLSAKDGAKVRLKLEDTSAEVFVELDAITESNGSIAWESLSWNFAESASFDATKTYDKASVFFDFGEVGDESVYYFDNVKFEGFIA